MSKDKLKLYSVKVANGSGCIFQPMINEYTYILTAKHLFYIKEKNDRGQDVEIEIENGTEIEIFKNQKIEKGWKEIKIPFTLSKGENYFPHPNKDADIAILKIEYIADFNSIFVQNRTFKVKDFELCGFPESRYFNNEGERYATQIVEEFMATGNFCQGAQLSNDTLQQADIEGFSGGGILKVIRNNVYIIGIQSKMASKAINQVGQIGFVQIKFFEDIINHYKDQLTELYPDYMSNFSFLRDESFMLEVDALDEDKIEATRATLKNKALDIIKSDITPHGIKELFKERILLDDKCPEHLSIKNVWIAWLEFLTIMNIIKYENIESATLTEIFDAFRLKYSDKDDWTDLIKNDLLNSDYLGLTMDSTVVVSTKKAPRNNFKLPKGKLVNLVKVPDKKGMRTDNGINHPYNAFNFVHLEYFKTKCIQQRLELYENINDENELLNILKNQYDELFN
ncbi:ABC-three component system protein [Winogradskyella sp.]|uniref:ABC-three component system protein n=1 Tax=Winogradskyella sp. TaxID=1883156 RepID=UPI00262582EF|nr:ABC-three component system protein [Winogradskyella sp.]